MRKSVILAVVAGCLYGLSPTRGADFSADMKMTHAGTQEPQKGKVYVKGKKFRMDMVLPGGQEQSIIFETGKGTLLMLNHQTRMCMKVGANMLPAGAQPPMSLKELDKELEKKGRERKRIGTEVANGYECEKYLLTGGDESEGESTIWWSPKLEFPVRMVHVDATRGKTQVDYENIKAGNVSDSVFEKLLRFVDGGGTLYVSGDFSFDGRDADPHRDRLRRLAGVQFQAQLYPSMTSPPDADSAPQLKVEPKEATVLVNSDDGPVLVHRTLGAGQVLYCLDPVELRGNGLSVERAALDALRGQGVLDQRQSDRDTMDSYELILMLGCVPRLPVVTHGADVFAGSVPTSDGGMAYVLFNTESRRTGVYIRHGGRELGLALGARQAGLAVFGPKSELRAVECQSGAAVNGKHLWEGEGHFSFISLDGSDLADGCSMILAMATGEGTAAWQASEAGVDQVVEHGEFRDGRWVALRRQAPMLPLEAKGALRSSLMLVTNRADHAKARSLAEQLLAR